MVNYANNYNQISLLLNIPTAFFPLTFRIVVPTFPIGCKNQESAVSLH